MLCFEDFLGVYACNNQWGLSGEVFSVAFVIHELVVPVDSNIKRQQVNL